MEKDKIIIRNCDNIEIEGHLYFIPEKYTAGMYIGAEYKKLFNYILAHIIHNRIHKDSLKMESINKIQLDKYLIITEKIFSFIITGKLDNIGFNQWENEIISIIPDFIIPKLNTFIVERLE
jgi:hypothetical protein